MRLFPNFISITISSFYNLPFKCSPRCHTCGNKRNYYYYHHHYHQNNKLTESLEQGMKCPAIFWISAFWVQILSTLFFIFLGFIEVLKYQLNNTRVDLIRWPLPPNIWSLVFVFGMIIVVVTLYEYHYLLFLSLLPIFLLSSSTFT